jgi:hypothetical protein
MSGGFWLGDGLSVALSELALFSWCGTFFRRCRRPRSRISWWYISVLGISRSACRLLRVGCHMVCYSCGGGDGGLSFWLRRLTVFEGRAVVRGICRMGQGLSLLLRRRWARLCWRRSCWRRGSWGWRRRNVSPLYFLRWDFGVAHSAIPYA